jgi:TPR repeat protein
LGRGGDAGDTEAQHKYAWLLLQGRGVIKDEEAAARWYSTAASHGDKYSYLALAEPMRAGPVLPVILLKRTRSLLLPRSFLTTATYKVSAFLI